MISSVERNVIQIGDNRLMNLLIRGSDYIPNMDLNCTSFLLDAGVVIRHVEPRIFDKEENRIHPGYRDDRCCFDVTEEDSDHELSRRTVECGPGYCSDLNNKIENSNVSRGNYVICDCLYCEKHCTQFSYLLILSLWKIFMCLYKSQWSIVKRNSHSSGILLIAVLLMSFAKVNGFNDEFDKKEQLMDKINLEQSIAAVFNKVAYGSTTKRSIPDNVYPVTTLVTPLLTTYRYINGNDEWLRVDTIPDRSNVEFEQPDFESENSRRDLDIGYGADLEKDHALPTSAPAADILKNNNNKHYNNPNRYNNDRLKPDFNLNNNNAEQVTENIYKTTTSYNLLKNVRPTKSIYGKEPPSYVPPSRSFFTPPLPPEYQNPFADKPTLRGTNSDSYANRRPIPPPSLMPTKDRIPFRPDLPKVNVEKVPERPNVNNNEQYRPPNPNHSSPEKNEKKKSLNTPSHNVRVGEFHGHNRNLSESNFEYEKIPAIPAITRILSGSNGRHEDISDILLRTVTATPNLQHFEPKITKTRIPPAEPSSKVGDTSETEYTKTKLEDTKNDENNSKKDFNQDTGPPDRSESVTIKKDNTISEKKNNPEDVTTQMSDVLNLPNVKEKDLNKEMNVTIAKSDEIWLICWNVHVYLVVFGYILLATFSIFKLIRYENDPHMFSKSYFLTIHLMLTVICVLRIFYLVYDPYNLYNSFNIFLYDFLHNFPLSLLATTFAVLILFLLKRTLTHLEIKTRPVFLIAVALLHIALCFCVSIVETLGYFDKASLTVCKPSFVLLAWALGFSYLYLYKIIKNVLAKKSQNLSEMCTQNISYASHITIAVALLFILLGLVQVYALFFIKVDRFNKEIKHHWILWSFELSVRLIEISIITLLAIVVSLKMSQREKQSTGGFPLFPCTTSDSSTDNIYPNNCNTNPNALNYSRQEMIMDNIPTEPIERPNLLKNAFQNDSFDKKSTLERYQSDSERSSNFDRFERPKWGSDRFDSRQNVDGSSLSNFTQPNSGNFERGAHNSVQNSLRNERSSGRKAYDSAKYYVKPKYDIEYNNEDYQQDMFGNNSERNIYSEPVDNPNSHQYERTRHEFERSDFDRRSRNSSNTSGRRSTGRARKNHPRPHLGVQTLPNHDRHQMQDSMLVDEQGFVRFRHMQEELDKPKKIIRQISDQNHYSDA
ncbi:uncharacterized protein LOC130895024 [Diorhabda carinulata]|uniref:uncharacterized protein LOC130895024 n=1 Tax=Diorhabda carinulata TaxID=1163345 RepID=UPI0025A16265|nr:uncharacterized protein LOC130895024 [Diorhabda carinulata]XP_057658101.1 uncharacterized protein LOC130895024 [Diorhabda carinulata]XP_057658102.1 uncharacterized protein LOC130895024 [Diorhabda carinulata]XP_057658103.1 uncharacterized protein LOC130895024 [Diorhabda carinulata]XP_057658105.1 uncharacterized protein LOC130895024 [Diorhabda carinulata]XP_057658106.1 uncharacterized protein LOC130895024 [Diorhabda carinulata]XP_057658107.1 uncharacterized protein LOC130895024 [Diorhabda ca